MYVYGMNEIRLKDKNEFHVIYIFSPSSLNLHILKCLPKEKNNK